MPQDKDDTLGRAKESARKLAGWLGARLGDAADRVKDNPAVRERLDQLEEVRSDRAHAHQERELQAAYQPTADRLAELIARFEQRTTDQEAAKAVVHANLTDLRNRGVAADDPELIDYTAQLADLVARLEELHGLLVPLRDERDRIERRFNAALARLQAGTDGLAELQAAATAQCAEFDTRIDAILAGGPE